MTANRPRHGEYMVSVSDVWRAWVILPQCQCDGKSVQGETDHVDQTD